MESSVVETADGELTLVKQQFEEYASATVTYRANAERWRDYKDGNQLTAEELKTLKKRKQPPVIDNKIEDKVNALLGLEKQSRTDPKAFPRNPNEDDSAEAATDALRYVADSNSFGLNIKPKIAENLIIEGLCFGQVIIEKKKGKAAPKISIEEIRWDRGYYDIHSLKTDFTDKEHCGFFTWMDTDVAVTMWPDKKDVIDQSFTEEATTWNSTHDDKPRYVQTVRNRKRVQVFEHYHKAKGVWHASKWCNGGFLEKPKPSAYVNEDGEPECCIEIQALYRDREGNPYGAVKRYMDLQDEHNKRRSKALHLLNSRQIKMTTGAGDVNKIRAELHKPDGVIEFNDGFELDILENTQLAQGQFEMMKETALALSLTGPNAALLGQTGSVSGRAKQIDQQAGTLTVAPLFDALKHWQTRIFRAVWCRVRQYWTAEMWIRVTDDENGLKFVALNEKMTLGHVKAKELKNAQMPIAEKQAAVQEIAADPQMQQPALDEKGQQMLDNNVAEMDVDIIIDESPDVVTVQQEQFETLAELAKGGLQIPPDALIEASSLRNKKRILDKMSGADNPQAQAMAEMKQRMDEMQMKMTELDVMAKQVDLQQKQADIAKTQADTDLSANKAVNEHVDTAIKLLHKGDPVQMKGVVN